MNTLEIYFVTHELIFSIVRMLLQKCTYMYIYVYSYDGIEFRRLRAKENKN